ncbi:MAG TPA: glycosyltransferase, partial [Myxococcales bacterium]|nr:glycosyltransferase [Myxococcales bacterium]
MRVLLTTIGSRGDMQPFVALGIELRDRGHEVEFLAPENFTEWLTKDHGFINHAGVPDVQNLLAESAQG